jgi:hypothetical protein
MNRAIVLYDVYPQNHVTEKGRLSANPSLKAYSNANC